MQEDNYNLGTRLTDGEMYSAGIAYVVIPSDVDRDKYIRECYKTSTVSISSEHNGWNNRVPIDRFSLNFIDFPKEQKKFGTAVCYVLEPIRKKPIVVGIYSREDELCDLKENQFKFRRELHGNFVELSGSPEEGFLGLNVTKETGGKIKINLSNNDETGELEINVDGECRITSSNDTLIKQYNKLTLQTINKEDDARYSLIEQTSDENNFKADTTNIDTDKFHINGGEEPFMLGTKTAIFLKDAIEEIGNSTITTMLGQMPLLNSAKILSLQKRVDELLSEVGFINK